jgi:hypothetical protein
MLLRLVLEILESNQLSGYRVVELFIVTFLGYITHNDSSPVLRIQLFRKSFSRNIYKKILIL